MANDQRNSVDVSGRLRAGFVGHFTSTHAFCSSHPSNITQHQCRCFLFQEDLNQEFFRTRSQYRVTEVRTLLLLPLLIFSPIDEDSAPRVV